ncbi:nitrate/nitrite transporter [Saccharopolyspora sp. NPDC000359]|uniref:nitrate/nitrite transporter n=1 Tax=Saccharopolyspora sp. NPDC000359 TaxID=3154251 RepID=UPI0033308EC6
MTARAPTRSGRWIEGWNPEDERFWAATGRRVARRNLIFSILSEHIGFSVWSIWSVLVLFMSPEIGLPFTAAEKFLLVVTPNLVGAVLRLPYAAAVTRFGGRNWTVLSSAVLLVPAALACYFVQQPGTPLWVFLLIGATAGVGGGNFSSSMTNITTFFPQRHQGWALGLNAGGGNLGVAAVQVVGLLVIAAAGSTSPAYVAAIYLPLIVVAAVCAALFMDNVDAVRARPGALREAAANKHTWWISVLYIGTFGSFIGYSSAFGLVLQTEFGATPLQAASWTFLGPLLGSVSRPVGGWMSDRLGGGRVTLWAFAGMAAGTAALLLASSAGSFAGYLAAFTALFVLTGIGNGSTYKVIPAIFAREAEDEVTGGGEAVVAFARARRLSGAVIGIAGAVGALGGVGINMAFRASYGSEAANGDAALAVFLGYYLLCALVTWTVYLRGALRSTPAPQPAPSRAEAARA